MAKWRILAIAVAAILILSIVSGYIFSSMMTAMTAAPKLEHYPAQVMPVATATPAPPLSKEPPPSEEGSKAPAPEVLTAYTGQGRMISYTARISLLVSAGGVRGCVDNILSIMEAYGGYVSSMEVREKGAILTVKVPQDGMMEFIEEVSKTGRVVDKTVSGVDLTDRIIDLEARLRNAREVERSLLDLLKMAKNVSDVLDIMRELSIVREEIEVMEAQLRNLRTSASYATVTVEVSEEEPRRGRVEVLFRVLDSRGLPVPGAHIHLKAGEVRGFVTDEFGEAKAEVERGSNMSLIAVFHRPDGEVLRASMAEVADHNKTVIIRFNKPSEPPAIDLERLSAFASILVNYLVTGLVVLAILIAPLAAVILVAVAAMRKIRARLAPRR